MIFSTHKDKTERDFEASYSDLPVENLRRLFGIEDEAGVVPPQHGHDTQTQAGCVAANQTGWLQQQLSFNQTQLVEKLQRAQSTDFYTNTHMKGYDSKWQRLSNNANLDGEVYEATNVERVLHEVEDELDVLDQRQVIGHP